jgi:predicted nucleic acid-binding protein
LVYLYSKTEPQKKQIVLKLLSSKNVTISTQVIGEFVWVMYRKFGIEREKLEVVPINPKTVKKALNIFEVYKLPSWDSLIVASALEANCSILYTEDMQNGQVIENRLKIVNPFTTKQAK